MVHRKKNVYIIFFNFYILVVECPTEDYVNPLTNNTAFFKHQGLAKPENVAFVVVHFTPQHIIDDTRYSFL